MLELSDFFVLGCMGDTQFHFRMRSESTICKRNNCCRSNENGLPFGYKVQCLLTNKNIERLIVCFMIKNPVQRSSLMLFIMAKIFMFTVLCNAPQFVKLETTFLFRVTKVITMVLSIFGKSKTQAYPEVIFRRYAHSEDSEELPN